MTSPLSRRSPIFSPTKIRRPPLSCSVAAGAILTGFVLMDYLGLVQIAIALAVAGTLCAVLLIAVHHIAFDGWSWAVLIRELGSLYAAFAAGRPSPLPELSVQYGDFAAWQRRHQA